MDLRTDSLFAGVAGVETEPEEFALGHGVVLRQTYAHFMAPFLMAFTPAKPGCPHPAPWSAVEGGLGVDIHVELHVPAEFEIPRFFDRLNTIWWIAALIRLRGASAAHVPVVSDRSFSKIPQNWKDATTIPVEAFPRRLFTEPPLVRLSQVDLDWLKETWLDGGRLMHENSDFNDAVQAFDSAGGLPNPSVGLLALWGALEHLFSPARQELRFRVSANIAAYLEPPGQARLELHRHVMKLYDARSGVAHGATLNAADAWKESYTVANRVLHRILAACHIPSKDDLERELFAPSPEPR